jgi:hypothetical protein
LLTNLGLTAYITNFMNHTVNRVERDILGLL